MQITHATTKAAGQKLYAVADWNAAHTALDLLVFGDGSDGDVTISAPANLTRNWFYNNLTVNAGVQLGSGGYKIYVRDTLTLIGTIAWDGNNGGNAVGATGGSLGAGAGYAALGGGNAGKAGANG